MALCDTSRLDRFQPTDATALRQWLLDVGVTAEVLRPVSKLCEQFPDPLRNPIRRWHLRRMPRPIGTVLRAFFFADPVAEVELREALENDRLLEHLLDSGLLCRDAAGLGCPLRLNLINDLFIFTDDLCQGGEAVMGAGPTTAGIIQAAWPSQHLDSILDMGCGAGTAALLMARSASRTLGVDISQRALTISRLNAKLAGATNVDFQWSDLFSSIESRQFDLIVAQPPFVSRPMDSQAITFLYGGARGDELALKLIEQIPQRLAPGGRAVLLVDWPRYDDVSPTDRIRAMMGDVPLDLLVLLATKKDLDEHVTFYGSMMKPSLGEDFEQYVFAHREHLERMNIRELRLALIVMRRTEHKPWTRLVEIRPMMEVEPTGAQLDRLIAVQDLLARDTATLLAASLTIPPGTKFVEQDAKTVRVELPASRLVAPALTSRAGADLLVEVDRAETVSEAAEAMLLRVPQLRNGGTERVLEGVRGALNSGLLELVEAPADSA